MELESAQEELVEDVQALVEKRAEEMYPQARVEAFKAWQRAPHALEVDELESLALLGLAQATAKYVSYCERKNFDPRNFDFLNAYFLRRMRGAILDAMRSQDWVTRSTRTRAKTIRDAQAKLGSSAAEADIAAETGLSVEEIRETVAQVSCKPVSFDAETHDVADASDVESTAFATSILEAAMQVMRELPYQVQSLLVFKYYYGLPEAEAAAMSGVEEQKAADLLRKSVVQVHAAMKEAAS